MAVKRIIGIQGFDSAGSDSFPISRQRTPVAAQTALSAFNIPLGQAWTLLVGGAQTATLPDVAMAKPFAQYIIKDLAGNAGAPTNSTKTIQGKTVKQLIDGATTITITTNYGSVKVFTPDNDAWYSIT